MSSVRCLWLCTSSGEPSLRPDHRVLASPSVPGRTRRMTPCRIGCQTTRGISTTRGSDEELREIAAHRGGGRRVRRAEVDRAARRRRGWPVVRERRLGDDRRDIGSASASDARRASRPRHAASAFAACARIARCTGGSQPSSAPFAPSACRGPAPEVEAVLVAHDAARRETRTSRRCDSRRGVRSPSTCRWRPSARGRVGLVRARCPTRPPRDPCRARTASATSRARRRRRGPETPDRRSVASGA